MELVVVSGARLLKWRNDRSLGDVGFYIPHGLGSGEFPVCCVSGILCDRGAPRVSIRTVRTVAYGAVSYRSTYWYMYRTESGMVVACGLPYDVAVVAVAQDL
jgi:hypothetical protein